MRPLFTDLCFTPASHVDQDEGLLGYLAMTLGPLRFDGITVRRTEDGRLALSYPSRVSATGREYPFIRPLGDHERREVEFEIFQQLGLEGGHER